MSATNSYKDEHGPSERVIEAMADCLLKTPNCVTREEIIAAWRVAVSALSEQEYQRPGDEIRAELRNGSVVYFGSAEAAVRIEQLAPVSATRDTIIEECAKVCDETAQFQSEMALNTNTEESMVTYRKARAWDASVCAAKIRALKRHDDIHDVERKP